MKASENEYPKVTFAEGAAPGTPDAGLVIAYAKTDGKVYAKDDAGTEYDLTASGSGGLDAGTSFPGAPSSGDVYFRTDRGLLYYYDGTRWVTTTLYYQNFSGPISVSGAGAFGRLAVVTDYDYYVYKCSVAYLVDTTNSGSAYWTMELFQFDGASSTSLGTVTSAAESANTFYVETITVDAAKSGIEQYQVNGTKTGSPGVLVATATLVYRLIG